MTADDVTDAIRSAAWKAFHAEPSAYLDKKLAAAIAAAINASGCVLVPREILDRFPEINTSNYDHDEVCALNAWGVELVLAAPQPGKEKGDE